MKLITKNLCILFLATTVFSFLIAYDEDFDHRDTIGVSFFHARSDGSNKARESAGMANLITWGFDDCSHGVLWATGAYARSFDQRDIGKFLFFNGSDTMTTGTAMGPGVDIFGENFLVNDDFNSAITARPFVTNGLVDINLFLALDCCCNGLYFLAHAPFVHTEWSIDFIETVSNPGTVILANHLGNPTNTPAPFTSMTAAWNGQATFFDVQQPLQFARVNGKQKKSKFSDIELALGYVILNDDCNYFSINVRGIIPTGNRPTAEFFFEPIVGNGHYGEVGAGILANFFVWEGCCDDFMTVFVNANIYTMLSSRQMRTFDLTNNGIGSRYLLFKQFADDLYTGQIVRGPNILTLPVSARNAAHGDVVVMVEYVRHDTIILDVGYNLWGRTRDHLTLQGSIPINTFGVAGLSGTAANANLTASQTLIDGTNASSIDATPVFISNADINIQSAAHPGAFSHGFFAHAQYLWCAGYVQPFLGVGTEIEFSGTNRSLKTWHVWAKTGFSF